MFFILNTRYFKILISGLPEPKKIDIRALYPSDLIQISKFFFCETQFTVSHQLVLYLLDHLRSKMNIRVSAAESPGRLIRRELVIDRLSHGKLIHICLKETCNDSFQFHIMLSSMVLFLRAKRRSDSTSS